MQAIDSIAIEQLGIPRLLLMDHAGLAVARQAAAFLPDSRQSIFIACGGGYNGGDGLSAARHLAGWGLTVNVGLIGKIKTLKVEPAIFAGCAQRLGVAITELNQAMEPVKALIESCDVIIDALIGVGSAGPVREGAAALIHEINNAKKPVVAVDLPSGLNGDTGEVQGQAVFATVTVAFGRIKKGCTVGEGPKRAGQLLLEPITFPNRLLRLS